MLFTVAYARPYCMIQNANTPPQNLLNMKKVIFLLLSIAVFGCASDSKITSSWKSKKRTKVYHDVVILALTNDIPAKQLVETDMEDALRKQEVSVKSSIDVLPQSFSKETPKDQILKKVRATGADAILSVSLINKETQRRYVPGAPGYVPGFWGYYQYWSPTVYTPGYYTEDRVYYIETNLYDAATDQLIWSAQSESYNPASLTGFSKELANRLAEKLIKDNIIGPAVPLSSGKKVTTSR